MEEMGFLSGRNGFPIWKKWVSSGISLGFFWKKWDSSGSNPTSVENVGLQPAEMTRLKEVDEVMTAA